MPSAIEKYFLPVREEQQLELQKNPERSFLISFGGQIYGDLISSGFFMKFFMNML